MSRTPLVWPDIVASSAPLSLHALIVVSRDDENSNDTCLTTPLK